MALFYRCMRSFPPVPCARLVPQAARFPPVRASPLSSLSGSGTAAEVIVSAREVSFEYIQKKPILKAVDFSIREANKITIMGQNGAGKSTILKLLSGHVKPDSGEINIKKGLAVATALQVMPRDLAKLTVWDFFKHHMHGNESGLDSRIARALNVVQLDAPHGRTVSSFSGGQQARLLLASALLGEPDLLLLDEPTNNLDKEGIYNLTGFLQEFNKTAIVGLY
jgi:ATPase subunit of ABC transporter with duplicated ATPase domains